AWMAAPCDDDDSQAASEFPARIAFVPRRGRALQPGRLLSDDPRSQAVTEVLTKFGAQYLDQIAERASLSERDTLAALWRLAAAGAVSNDSFAPLRLLWSEPDAMRLIGDGNVGTRAFTRHDAAVRARLKSSLSGRWSMIESARSDGQ